jgi:hypothetical protein
VLIDPVYIEVVQGDRFHWIQLTVGRQLLRALVMGARSNPCLPTEATRWNTTSTPCIARFTIAASRTSPSINATCGRGSTLVGLPDDRSSSAATVWPFAEQVLREFEPIKPPPPNTPCVFRVLHSKDFHFASRPSSFILLRLATASSNCSYLSTNSARV